MKNHEISLQLAGRRLLLTELPVSEEMIETNAPQLRIEPALRRQGKAYECIRCGNRSAHLFASTPCVRCGKHCMYCRNCVGMGRMCECSKLVSWSGSIVRHTYSSSLLNWEGTLSEGQALASTAVIDAIARKENHLIWAVCGAGKTEVLFAGIDAALQRGDRVCIATPRTDVVLELAPRLKKVFPSISVLALYGGSHDLGKSSPLIISTTHQLLRYYRAFDTIILDEVDAFPYSVDCSLQYAVMQAKTENGSLIYLTATPSAAMKKKVQAGKLKATMIPARYHQYPLPVPIFSWCGNWRSKIKRNKLPSIIWDWIVSHLRASRPVFLFIPRISYIAPLTSALKTLDARITGVHAEDRDRKEKVASFRNGDIPLLVTSTILERGVTVRNLQVAVLGAEEDVFTESALVQIAGRVGRNRDFPSGDVIFFHFGKTEAMVDARMHIVKMNKRAKKMGWTI
ncbi:DEAD/DEAH box helicase [Ectobacillus polymachus]|uniref:DEAD/DEAH box helicase n=1 Tax=Ectobacillus polymachus TaxID=1508806 RepID=UPI003A84C178